MNMSNEAYSNLKEYAIKWFKDSSLNILPSIVLSYSILKLNNLSENTAAALMECNNPFAIEITRKYKGKVVNDETTDKKYRTFASMDEFANFALTQKGQYTTALVKVKGLVNYKSAISKLYDENKEADDMLLTINAYGLADIDKIVLEDMYPSSGKNIVDGVKEKEESPVISTPKARTMNAFSAVRKTTEVKERTVKFAKGETIYLNNANLFETPGSKCPTRSISGRYYLTNGVMINFRYAIVAKKDFVGDSNFNIGFVKKEDIK